MKDVEEEGKMKTAKLVTFCSMHECKELKLLVETQTWTLMYFIYRIFTHEITHK